MHSTFRIRFGSSLSDNLKSKTCGEQRRTMQNRQWAGIVALLVAFEMCGMMAEAQEPKKVPRLGYLSSSDAATDSARAEGIRRALREAGHIEGQNIVVEYRYAQGKI